MPLTPPTPVTPFAPTLLNRRAFLGQAATLAAACALLPRGARAATPAAKKPNSVMHGVRVGAISYSYRSALTSAEELLQALVSNGISEVELMGPAIQQYAGFVVSSGGKNAAPAPKYTDEQRAAQLAKCRELRKLYNDAGVNIHIHKIAFGPSDEEVEFNFLVAKALGCEGITVERSDAQVKRLAPFAEKHKVRVGFHNHTANLPVIESPDALLDHGKYVAFNFDIGHYVAGTKGKSPLPVLEKYHDRILNLHLKDRTADGGNLPWARARPPIKEVLQLIRQEKWTFPANIELEYKIPEGSDAVKEVAKCVDYCRAALA